MPRVGRQGRNVEYVDPVYIVAFNITEGCRAPRIRGLRRSSSRLLTRAGITGGGRRAFSTRSTVTGNPGFPAALPRSKEDAMAKATKKTSRGRSQDRKRVAGGQDYEVRYEAKKTDHSKAAVKKAVKTV